MSTAIVVLSGILAITAFIALVAVLAAGFVCVVAGTMVYSWWRKLQVTNDQLPELVRDALNEQVAQHMQPYRELFDDKTQTAVAYPTTSSQDEIPLDERYDEWLANT